MKVITFGEVMLRLSPPGQHRFSQATTFDMAFGGTEANVAVALAQWGVDVHHITSFPTNALGDAAVAHLRKAGVDTRYVQRGAGRMGLYFLEHGAASRASQVVYDRADSAFSRLTADSVDWETVFVDADGVVADWFHWTGITPAISAGTAACLLKGIETANRLGVPVSGDPVYRSNLWQYGQTPQDVLPELTAGCTLLLGNAGLFSYLYGINATTNEAAAQEMMTRFPRLRYVTDTVRESVSASHNRLSAWLYDGVETVSTPLFDVQPIIDRIGTGDAFMAGLIYGLLHGEQSLTEALTFGVAASVLKHTIPGDVLLATPSEIDDIAAGNLSGKIKR
ncbi:sugar kinase [Fibrella aestuarina]|nr:sugar kinase [Fibrella aestuarina]